MISRYQAVPSSSIEYIQSLNIENVVLQCYRLKNNKIRVIFYLQPLSQSHKLMEKSQEYSIHNSFTSNNDIVTANLGYKCSICHGTESIELRPYCVCKDGLGYVHSFCLKPYIQKKVNRLLEREVEYENGLKCEKCNQQFDIDYKISRSCSNKQKIKKTIERKQFLFGICIIGFILCLVALATFSSSLATGSQLGGVQKSTCIIFIIFSSILMLFFTFKIIQTYFTQLHIVLKL